MTLEEKHNVFMCTWTHCASPLMSSQRNLWFNWFKHRRRFSEIFLHSGRVTASNGGLGSPQKVLILGWDPAFNPEEFCIYDRDVCIKWMRAVWKLEHMYMLLFHLLILFSGLHIFPSKGPARPHARCACQHDDNASEDTNQHSVPLNGAGCYGVCSF